MQQLFRLLIFLNQPNIFWATNSPILRSTFWLYIQLLVQCTASVAERCHGWYGTEFRPNRRQHRLFIVPKAVHTIRKCSWGWANLSPETCRAELKRLINETVLHLVGYLNRCIKTRALQLYLLLLQAYLWQNFKISSNFTSQFPKRHPILDSYAKWHYKQKQFKIVY